MATPAKISCSQRLGNINGSDHNRYIVEQGMDRDEAIAHLVFKDLTFFLLNDDRYIGTGVARKFFNLTKPPMGSEDITFALDRLTSVMVNEDQCHDGNEKLLVFKEDLEAIKRFLQERSKLKIDCEKADRIRTCFIAKQVSEFIISKGFFTEVNKEKIQALNSDCLTLEQLIFLQDLISSSENIIVSEDDYNRVEGIVNYALEIFEEEKHPEGVQQLSSKLSIAVSAFESIESHADALKKTAAEL